LAVGLIGFPQADRPNGLEALLQAQHIDAREGPRLGNFTQTPRTSAFDSRILRRANDESPLCERKSTMPVQYGGSLMNDAAPLP